MTSEFVILGNQLRSYFDNGPDDESGAEVRTAWDEFTAAAQRLGRSVTSAFQDEDVQEGAKQAFGTLIDAVGRSVQDAGVTFPWAETGDGSPDDPSGDESAASDDGRSAPDERESDET